MAPTAEEKPDGAPEWMVSFADMITIMMSFFVIMFALASGEAAKGKHNNKQQQAAFDSLNYRFGPNWQPFASWGLMPGSSPVRGAGSRDKLKAPSRPLSEPEGEVKVLRKEQARIRIPGHGDHTVIGGIVFFDDGKSQVSAEQTSRLKVIAAELAGKPQVIEVLGHASRRPLPRGSSYRDRCDLAFARCRQTVDLLRAWKIDTARMWIGVVQTSGSAASGDAAGPGEDSQVDIYLTDLLPEKYTAANAGP
jgi:chemotaxis protein MotB